VPCSERCRCIDCKNVNEIYRQNPKLRGLDTLGVKDM
jgi:hypothetical protein